ncbi:phosphodiester glycosidase family protein [Paenibacillus allorhizosphaerae]|uniref:phosphodiester glycosidase family protein n=1 Tax=Paenibacillus allorhizosphaerae TaxID=2849866 RepID=UPI001C407470|nr:phosphodiester glycosidase family protein [Paenibacillus allorhizosphaerae]
MTVSLTYDRAYSKTNQENSLSDQFLVTLGANYERKTVEFDTMFRFRDKSQPDNGQKKGHIQEGSSITNVINSMKIDTNQPQIKLEVVSPGGIVAAKDTVTNMALQNDREGHRVIAGFNADFFDVPTGVPLGVQVTDGEVMTSPVGNTSTNLAIMENGSFRLGGGIAVRSSLQAEDGASLELSGVNKIRTTSLTNHAFLMTERFGSKTMSAGTKGVEVVIRPSEPNVKLRPGQMVQGVVEAVYTTVNNNIPKGKFVLTASGSKSDWVKQHAGVGKTVSFQIDFGSELNNARYMMGGANHPNAMVLLENGKLTKEVTDILNARILDHHPRTILASKGSDLYVFEFDGRQEGYSDGLSYLEGAVYMQSLGMEQAINIDGGGSSTFVVRKPGETGLTVMNRPSDGEERPIGNALIVVSTTP